MKKKRAEFETMHLAAHPCPVCGAKLDCASGWSGHEPRIGHDFTVCLYCSTVLKLVLPYRQATLDEMTELDMLELGTTLELAKQFQAHERAEKLAKELRIV